MNEGLDVLQWMLSEQGLVGLMIADGASVDLVRDQLQTVRSTVAGENSERGRWSGPAQRALRSLVTTE